ncbi:exodeoxyribonuclease VII small subunit [Finegoldia magna]|uniref:Exodeoxyribonuclease 7 small subunit n=2 Tax=Finegoldia magna TaxID=1260 RepID=EX7S_FINM2|nr:exodeoxyribonuclease VII small subunit [Finegoldia magna]B0S1L9.1 RecName: Full=Exodeoxyribonuclease 7 small subunit; AltName: Full=Exodeoxyribonuclease VII small subunit; Short=Exonuclease VII small subunit [Finegoldia magna ATCC 29328]EXF26820.1 exodeoxyribonuclease VII small subunit [Finegoldia magna ALB8]KXA09114.1 exodeoxyribonuclease VII, small subunit [Finegoldia magna]MDU1213411.1 exodeoxyribonuclease VII small subunit [Finegoldia magna]MDU2131719.1 exodeoxyribonuclease VII small su
MNEYREYDEGLKRLSEIVEKLEDRELSLEENIKLYEEGMKLHKRLSSILKEQEGKMTLIKDNKEEDFQINMLLSDDNE